MEQLVAEIVVAILALVGTLISGLMVSQKTTWRIDQLEKKMEQIDRKMEKHNRVVERVFLLEHDEEIQNKEIDEIREQLKNGANNY